MPSGPPVQLWVAQNPKGYFINATAGTEVATAGPFDWDAPPSAMELMRFLLMDHSLTAEGTPMGRMLERYKFKEVT